MEKMNGQVGIPSGYFLKMAKHDYNDYRVALGREFIQNSADAGAKQIEIISSKEDRTITVVDNGCGMSLETLTDKLLVLGGSKKAAGSVGAFGKAKELLFFSWETYQIYTREWVVRGHGAEYEITEATEPCKGTVCQIRVPDDEDLDWLVKAFESVAARSQLKCKVIVDRREIPVQLRKGKLVKTIEGVGNLHQVKSRERASMAVRVNGIWMFDRYIGHGLGEIVLELSKGSLELLTSNRDGLKQSAVRKVDEFLKDLFVDPITAMKEDPKRIKMRFGGTGKVKVDGQEVDELLMELPDTKQFAMEDIVNFLMAASVGDFEEGLAQERASALVGTLDGTNSWSKKIEALRMAGYQPDFVLEFDEREEAKVEKYMGKAEARMLTKMWTEIVKQVMIDNRMYTDFTAGFVFEEEIEGRCNETSDGHEILVNPWNLGALNPRKALVDEMKARAEHEVTHLIEKGHNERFTCAAHQIRRNTYKSYRAYAKIRKLKG